MDDFKDLFILAAVVSQQVLELVPDCFHGGRHHASCTVVPDVLQQGILENKQ